ncbi:YpmA family protein [Halobacillus shinanisalinarum]|uniref:YpmA family protein n=1 Tax=Halobacillus shinanisalinarum TaxID=2932258 RepID=A0ABY4GZF5_9BACI|nr:YpmA family protein [Halobacillus shinanisalinarum]UOQ93553.1 YpmA family protein [Halobacillus shinanisalinarum]
MENKVETMSTVRIQKSNDLYKVVDTLNRTLKDQNLMFGLALDEDDNETAVFTIYRT